MGVIQTRDSKEVSKIHHYDGQQSAEYRVGVNIRDRHKIVYAVVNGPVPMCIVNIGDHVMGEPNKETAT